MTIPEGPVASHEEVLKVFRVLIADLVQHYNGGHPGGAMGMAAIGVALWRYVLKFAPTNPSYFNRDRFVLSNGHTCLFQYTFHHLVGYKHMTMEQLKTYHSSSLESFCPGHPEIEHEGIEITTGALGQGISNSVGLAIASKNLAATYNKPDFPVVSNQIFCMVGDACLQEGVGLESISIAGHLGLDNLTVIYDDNQITCDGSVDMTNTEDINAKFKACGWNVIEIEDGSYDIEGIVAALEASKRSQGKPTLINVHTVIGVGSQVQGQAKAHGAAFGQAEVDRLHVANGFAAEQKFNVPDSVYRFFAPLAAQGEQYVKEWDALVASYRKAYPELSADFDRRVRGELPADWKSLIPAEFPTAATASRKSSGLVFNPVAAGVNNFVVGTSDLSPSVNLQWKGEIDFQNPNIRTSCGLNGDYSGRYIHFGIREHAMASISNGIAAYNKGTFIPVTSTFFMFYLYAAPGVRYGALSELQCIHVATHDSIGTGEDGPTHQPIALAALYRAMPNVHYIRPCDSTETAGAWEAAIEAKGKQTIISLSRQNLDQYPEFTRRDLVKKGAYILKDVEDPELVMIGVGPEMKFALEAAATLNSKGIRTRLVSFPCQRFFDQQPAEYRRAVLLKGKVPSVVVEAYAPNGWERYATAGINMQTFGKSLPGAVAYEYFGYNGDKIASKVAAYYETYKADPEILHEFQDLNQ